MSLWPSIIGAGASLLGGLLGSDDAEDARDDANARQATSDALQREFAQNGIQWRVEDAKRAGIHPVFALQGGGAAYAPSAFTVDGGSPMGDAMRDMGQNLSRAVAAQETADQRIAREYSEQEMLSRIKRNNSEAAMFDSLTVKNYNQIGPGMPGTGALVDPTVFADGGSNVASSVAGQVLVEPSKVTSYSPSDSSVVAGKDAMWKPFRMDRSGKVWYLPAGDDASDSLESVSESWPMQWMVLRENMRRNPYFLAENRHLFPFGDELGRAAEWSVNKYVDLERAAKIHWDKFGHRARDWLDRQRSYTGGYEGVRRRTTRKFPLKGG